MGHAGKDRPKDGCASYGQKRDLAKQISRFGHPRRLAKNFPLRGKFGSALVSPSLQNSPSRVGSHSLSEAVHFFARSLFGLIRSLHFFTPVFVFAIL